MNTKNIETIHRLSPLQEGILFHTLESAKTGVYFCQYSCEYAGPLDAERLCSVWSRIIERHGILRTLFTWDRRERPLQIVRKRVDIPWQAQDWRAIPHDGQRRRWESLLRLDRERGFDLGKAPLVRLNLIRLADDRYRFLFSFHHILMDGWSARLLLDEATRLYRDDDVASALPPAPQYGEFLEWLGNLDQAPALTFWESLLDGFSKPTSPFPPESKAPRSGAGSATLECALSERDSRRLESTARQQRVTLNTLVLAAWASVLGRYTGTSDVVFGTTVSGRPVSLDRAQDTVGLFINTLPIRLKIPEDAWLPDWLQSIQRLQSRMREYEHTPPGDIQRRSEVPAGTSIFETIVVFENFPKTERRGDDEIEILDEQYAEFSHYPLALLIVPGERIRLIAICDTGRLDRNMAEAILHHFHHALIGIGHTPDIRVRDLDILDDTDRRRILHDRNATAIELDTDRCIHTLFETTAHRRPDSIAIVDGSRRLTFRAVDRQANRLANLFQDHGVVEGALVPIIAERTADVVIAILAILKAGAAYVPIDPAVPDDRRARLITDVMAANDAAGRRTVVVTTGGPDAGRRTAIGETIDIEDQRDRIASCSERKPDVTIGPGDLAYVIYTSGSTGRPKGVMVSHRNLVNSTLARGQVYRAEFRAFLLLSSLATDSSVAGLFWSLATGAALVLPRGREEQDVHHVAGLIAANDLSHLLCVPSLYRLLLEYADASQLRSLNTVIVAGEPCPRDTVDLHERTLPNASLFNEYGPTEATVWASVAELRAEDTVTIGRPIANTQVYVLDGHLRPVPDGVAGEIYIGGAGIARGYLNDPDKTGARFIEDPFTESPNGRMYRTGDLARWQPDGRLQFLGRVDNQMKVRGFRVEPEEIEAALAEHPSVRESAVFLEQTGEASERVQQILADLSRFEPDEAMDLVSAADRVADERKTVSRR